MKNPFKRKSARQKVAKGVRGFDMGTVDRLTQDWLGTPMTMNQMLFSQLERMRQRARDSEINSPWIRRFLAMARTNVVGSVGFTLTARGIQSGETLDDRGNKEIERLWSLWSKPRNCSMSGQQGLIDVCNQATTRLFADGEYILRMVSGADNAFGFSLAPIPVDMLDHNLNRPAQRNADGTQRTNAIKLGVEVDQWDKPVAYHFLTGDDDARSGGYGAMATAKHIIYPAEDIIHIYPIERIGQTRGFSFIVAAGVRTKMLNAFEEAAVVNKRITASKMGFLIPDPENPPTTPYKGDGENEDGSTRSNIEPGVIEALPVGYKGFDAFDPSDAGDGFSDFSKTMLRSIASAFNVNYNTLANDLSEVNYSSIRHGALEDRDAWMCVQRFVIDHMLERIYPAWLKWTLTMGTTFIAVGNYEKFLRYRFAGRRWQWIDPLKEEAANFKALTNNTTSEIDIAERQGLDFDEIMEKRIRAKKALEAAGFAVVGAAEPEQPLPQEANNVTPSTTVEDHAAEMLVFEGLKAKFDSYGVGVRAGAITPQQDDEVHFRKLGGLPTTSSAVNGAWIDDEGYRRPITLAVKGEAIQPPIDEGAEAATDTE